jgi:hypothetical protein
VAEYYPVICAAQADFKKGDSVCEFLCGIPKVRHMRRLGYATRVATEFHIGQFFSGHDRS